MKTNQPQKNNLNKWQTIPVGDVFDFVKSSAFSRDNLSRGILSENKVGNIHYGDIHSTFTSESIDLLKIEIPIIKDPNFRPKKEELLRDGDLIMADVSEDYEGIGEAVSVHGIGNNRVIGGLHTFVLRDNKGLTDEYYRQYIFRNPILRNKLQKNANGISVYGVSKKTVSGLLLQLPPLSEQNRIASILETWDKVITKTSERIQIKKRIRKGLEQGLLTGKKRLNGFSGKWKTTPIKQFASAVSMLNIDDHSYEVLSCTKHKGLVRSLEYFDRKIYGNDLTKYKIVPNSCFVYATNHIEEGSIGYQDIVKFGLVSPMYTVFKTKDVNNVYLYKLLKTPRLIFEYRRHTTASVERRGGLRWKEFSRIKVNLPSLEEQTAIAKVLSSADDEIRELEKKLQFIKDQKKYLLNNLITGTIRTPETLSAKPIK